MRRTELTTGGNWDVSLRQDLGCCLEGGQPSDIHLVSTQLIQPGTPRRWLSALSPKGVRGRLRVTVVRINKLGVRRMARPCGKCMADLKERGVYEVLYSTNHGWETERI